MDPEERLELIALLARDEAWGAVVKIGEAILRQYYPEDIFTGGSGDTGPAYIVALRNALRAVQLMPVDQDLPTAEDVRGILRVNEN
jgi:hypothetical protein